MSGGNERRLNLGIGFDPSDLAHVNADIAHVEITGEHAAHIVKDKFLEVVEAFKLVSEAVKEGIHLFQEFTEAAQADERSTIDRNAALKQAGIYTKELTEQLDSQASTYQRNLGLGDEYIRSIQAAAAAQRVSKGELQDFTTASIQYAKIVGGDAVDAVKKLAKAVEDTTVNSIRGSTVSLKGLGDEHERIQALLQGTAAGMSMLSAEADTEEGAILKLNQQIKSTKEILGGQIGNSPDMAEAFNDIASAVHNLNEHLKETGGVGGVAAQGLLVVGAAVARAMGRIQQAADFFSGKNPLGDGISWGLPNDYTNPFLQADDELSAALKQLQQKQAQRAKLSPKMQELSSWLSDVGSAGYDTPGADTASDPARWLPRGGYTAPGAAGNWAAMLTGLAALSHTQADDGISWLGAGSQPGSVWANAITRNQRARGGALLYDRSFGVPDLSGGFTADARSQGFGGGAYGHPRTMNPEYNTLPLEGGAGIPDVSSKWDQIANAFGGPQIAQILRGFEARGLKGAGESAGGILGAATGNPLLAAFGGDIGGIIGGGLQKIGRFFGIGGHSSVQRGDTQSFPVYTVAKIDNQQFAVLAQAFYASAAAAGGHGIDGLTIQLQQQLGRVASAGA